MSNDGTCADQRQHPNRHVTNLACLSTNDDAILEHGSRLDNPADTGQKLVACPPVDRTIFADARAITQLTALEMVLTGEIIDSMTVIAVLWVAWHGRQRP